MTDFRLRSLRGQANGTVVRRKALLRWRCSGRGRMWVCPSARSDGSRELVEGCREPEMTVSGVDAELVVAATQVLDERVTTNDDPRGGIGLPPAHRPQPRLESAVVTLHLVIRVPRGVVELAREDLVQ